MREIKFRQFRDGRIIPIHTMYSDKSESEIAVHGNFNKIEDEVLMQFTGLKDKNGIDIYEGDILQIESEKLMVVGWSEKFASFVLNREGWVFSHWFGESCDPDSCIIKGNIHENPELLNT